MDASDFESRLRELTVEFAEKLSTNDGQWIVKGFIDVYKSIYTVSLDTKVLSKLIELMLFPLFAKFASDNGLKIVLSEHQNHYPDISFYQRLRKHLCGRLEEYVSNKRHQGKRIYLGCLHGVFSPTFFD